ncbi:alpha/beta hydrolase [uncultured Robinsoniella sp.]|uniref:alpha/beta hydrolase n=1 Tax=uncultured Robinsoniella sp. TaxID=904190 RepID=UPI00374E358A
MKNRKKKLIIGILIVLVLVLAAALGFIGNYFCNYALNPAVTNGIESDDDTDEKPDSADMVEAASWLSGEAEDIWMTSDDSLKLHAYKVDAKKPSNKYVVLCHGYKGEAANMAIYGKHFYESNYNILIPDARAHGQSEGKLIGMGWPERRDIVKWVNTIVSDDESAQILLMGVSMGAATVMMTSGEEDLPSQVKAVVEDCGYTSVWDEFEYQLKEMFGLPSFPVLNVSSAVVKIRAGYFLREASALKQIAKSHTPTLFIHGDQDTFVPYDMLDELYEAAAYEKEKLVIPGAAHGEARMTDSKTYWDAVDRFAKKYIK